MKIIELYIDEEDEGIQAISLVSAPAIEENWIALSDIQLKAIDNDRRLVMGAALVPNKAIIRNGKDGDYYITFSAETIRKASEGYMKAGHLKQANLEHQLAITGVTTVESWIVEDSQLDKSAVYGFSYDPGTWVVTMKVDNDGVWEEFVKTGRVKGFSIEGKFSERVTNQNLSADPLEEAYAKIEKALSEMAEEIS
jgi:hypothetical protein